MLKIYAHEYISAGRDIHDLGSMLYMSEDMEGDPGRPLTDDDAHKLKLKLIDLSKTCEKLGLN